MGGLQAGRTVGDLFFAAGLYLVESDDPAWAVMAGRGMEEGRTGPTFWFVHQDNPEWRKTNLMVAFGKPGIPKAALCNPQSNGIYTALYTDQAGQVVPIEVRNFEEGRIWIRPDEWAQSGTGAGGAGGWALALDSFSADVGYEKFEMELFYTHQRLGACILPHVGGVIEREKLPGIGRQDWRYGIELGTYLGGRQPDKFFQGGRFYIGLRATSDFDDYSSLMGELRLNL